MTTVTLDTAKTDLAALLDRALAGEEIIIANGDAPGERLAPVDERAAMRARRGFGILKGKIRVSGADPFNPLPDGEPKLWNGQGDWSF
jgi:antitoxin (DNA-binding transcriptional repressor) of toxin-antitoxin stability system